MDTKTFVAELVKAVAWPLAAIAALLLLRRQIALLVAGLRKLKYGDVEADFYSALPEPPKSAPPILHLGIPAVAALAPSPVAIPQSEASPEPLRPQMSVELAQHAEAAPRATLIEAWMRISGAAVDAVRRAGVELTPQAQYPAELIESELLKQGVLTQEQVAVLRKLRELRDTATHAQTQPPPGIVLHFVGLADWLYSVLQHYKKGA